jgi:anaerobic magnesium-protoporphyrin IX monomethyl ester cyclase
MRVLFVQDNPLDESLALIELAALLDLRGHRAFVLLDREERDLLKASREIGPDLVVVACSMLNHGWARGVATRLSALGAPILAGGTAPTLYPELLRNGPFAALIRGEADRPVLAAIEALASGSGLGRDVVLAIPGLALFDGDALVGTPPGPGIPMTEVPVASKDLYYDRYPFMRRFPFKRFLASRGCHHRCSYCYISALNKVQPREPGGTWTRYKSPEQIVDEIVAEKAKGPLTHVHFSDDLFTVDADWLARFAPLYRRRVGIPFTCNTSAELVTEAVAAALAEAGCWSAGFAVETGNSELRLRVLRKGVTEDNIRNAGQRLRHHGIKLATFNMIALPGETPDGALETAALNAEIGTDFVRMNYAFPMPGTTMNDYALEKGLLPADWMQRFASPGFRYAPGPQFATPYRREFENLFVLFRVAAKDQRFVPAVKRLLSVPSPKVARQLLTLQGAWNEKLNFRIPTLEGIRYFARVGRPELRSTNFPALL